MFGSEGEVRKDDFPDLVPFLGDGFGRTRGDRGTPAGATGEVGRRHLGEMSRKVRKAGGQRRDHGERVRTGERTPIRTRFPVVHKGQRCNRGGKDVDGARGGAGVWGNREAACRRWERQRGEKMP
jgi:hypothetical protein